MLDNSVSNPPSQLKIRTALLSVSDKDQLVELGQAFVAAGVELVATGRTAKVLQTAGLKVIPIEEVSGSPEAFQGRMKTLSFSICGGILYRRGDARDEADLAQLQIRPIDCVVVNFYPFEKAVQAGTTGAKLIEEIDIGGPTLVRAAAKNSPDVLVLTSPAQYASVIQELRRDQAVSHTTVEECAAAAWELVLAYDTAIAQNLGTREHRVLRYGENPHQSASLTFDPQGPVGWGERLTPAELSYNNILDFSAAYSLASDLVKLFPDHTGVVIVKHGNPCGVAWVPKSISQAQKTAQMMALLRAWEGDPVSAFGGVVVFTDPLEEEVACHLGDQFVELVAAPGLSTEDPTLQRLSSKRRKLKALAIRRWGEMPSKSTVQVPGGCLVQSLDDGAPEMLNAVTRKKFSPEKAALSPFGIAVCRALKSNAIALVREVPTQPGVLQLVGAGQGQPNRIEALKVLAVPRAQKVLEATEGSLSDCLMVSDAFFPFRDTVDTAVAAGIQWIIQPGGSLKDSESILACDENDVAMAFTGVRHFKH